MKSFDDLMLSLTETYNGIPRSICEILSDPLYPYHPPEGEWAKLVDILNAWTGYDSEMKSNRQNVETFLKEKIINCSSRVPQTKYSGIVYRGFHRTLEQIRGMGLQATRRAALAKRMGYFTLKGRYLPKNRMQSWTKESFMAMDFATYRSPISPVDGGKFSVVIYFKPDPNSTINISSNPPMVKGLRNADEGEVIVNIERAQDVTVWISEDHLVRILVPPSPQRYSIIRKKDLDSRGIKDASKFLKDPDFVLALKRKGVTVEDL